MKETAYLLFVTCILLLSGCGEPPWHAGIDEYQQRVARVLDIKVEPANWAVPPVGIPKRRQLLVPEPKASVGLIDFLRLSKCDLQRLVGKSNGNMERFQAASQKLFYQAEFTRLARECIEGGHVPSDLLPELKEVLAEKRKAVPTFMWNAFWSSVEVQKLYAPLGESLPVSRAGLPATIEQALGFIVETHRAFANEDLSYEMRKGYEEALATLGASNYAGALLHQQRQLAAGLSQLAGYLEGAEFCVVSANGSVLMPARKKDALMHVFQSFYIQGVQAPAMRLIRQRDSWLTWQWRLRTEMEPPESMQAYFQQWQLAAAELDAQIAWHTRFWREGLGSCGLAPKAN